MLLYIKFVKNESHVRSIKQIISVFYSKWSQTYKNESHACTLKGFKNAKYENYYFLHPEHF